MFLTMLRNSFSLSSIQRLSCVALLWCLAFYAQGQIAGFNAGQQYTSYSLAFTNRIFGQNYSSMPNSSSTTATPGYITGEFTSPGSAFCVSGSSCSPNCIHKGLDQRAATTTSLYSPVSGVVKYAGGTFGTVAIYNATNDFTFFFLHMSTISVTVNSTVSVGQYLGKAGNAGVSAVHCHTEIRKGSWTSAALPCGSAANTNNYDPRISVALSTTQPAPAPTVTTAITNSPNLIQQNQAVTVTATVKNNGSAAFNGQFACALHNSAGAYVEDIQILNNVSMTANQTQTFTFTKSTITSVPGSYQIVIKSQPSGSSTWTNMPGPGFNPKAVNIVAAPSNSLTLSPTSQNVGATAGTTTISVTGNVSWTSTDNATWLNVTPASGTGNGALQCTYQTNTGIARTATVTVIGGGLTRTATITQLAGSSGGSGLANDNPCTATIIVAGNGASYTNGTSVGATNTTNPGATSTCNFYPYDVWYKVQVPSTGIVTVRTLAGSLTNGIMAIYNGSCSALAGIICEDNNTNGNGSYMPVITVTGQPIGSWLHIRVWGYGNTTGTFQICALNYSSVNMPTPGNGHIADGVAERGVKLNATMKVFPNPVHHVLTLQVSEITETATIKVFDANGRLVIERLDTPSYALDAFRCEIPVAELPNGLYQLQWIGNAQVQNSSFVVQRN
jgi:Peptidase family M23/Viral BACON domain/Secretion system C-terminal sorting domain